MPVSSKKIITSTKPTKPSKAVSKKAISKKAVPKEAVSEEAVSEEAVPKEDTSNKSAQKAGGKSKKVSSSIDKSSDKVTTTNDDSTKSARSFKVKLPDTENYVGRFTGLTPYQAANKALSKYYRETNKPKQDIRFSIKESTRGSKRSEYTYNGGRHKLDEPVRYTISNSNGEAREIVKNFKNRLTKIKKNELAHSE